MVKKAEGKPPLQGYRVLDLMESGIGLCAKLLGDWGAEVVKIEPPGGSSLRNLGPFYHDDPHPEKSLFWFAYNTGKKSVTLNIESKQGQEILKQLVKKADFLVESFTPGYLDGLGLGYSALSQINPKLIMVSITPFGQTGPYSKFKSYELVTEAMSGIVYNLGEPDRPPSAPMSNRVSCLPAMIAEIEGAAGASIASYHRRLGGDGQQVDVSVQECASNVIFFSPMYWDISKVIVKREGGGISRISRGVPIVRRAIYKCKDGYVQAYLHGELFEQMVEWLDSEGEAGDLMTDREKWIKRLSMAADPPLRQEEVDHMEGIIGAFLARRTKAEIYEAAEKRGIGWSGICSVGETLSNVQLLARGFFTGVNHPQLRKKLLYPRPPFLTTEMSTVTPTRAPLIGEHNSEIYKELGFTRDDLVFFKQSGVI